MLKYEIYYKYIFRYIFSIAIEILALHDNALR